MTRNLNEIERFFNPEPTTTIQPKQSVTIGFKRLTEDAVLPTKAHATDSGYDLVASEDVVVMPGETAVVKTGIAVELPAGYEATVRPRSGVTAKTKLRVQLGTIDNGYGGEIGVIVDNIAMPHFTTRYSKEDGYVTTTDSQRYILTLDSPPYEEFMEMHFNDLNVEVREHGWYMPRGTYKIRKGDKIAQMVITRLPEVVGTEVFEIDETVRGSNGFGSTGV